VITDWGGVMTNPLLETVRAWIEADGIDFDRYLTVMRAWVSAAYDGTGEVNPIHALERGECSDAEFERLLAAELVRRDGAPVPPDGLLSRMFAASVYPEAMQHLLRAVRAAGVRTALLSNSWGFGDYPRHLFPELFDVVVLSGEVGMRKPEERIFQHAAGLLGLAPDECVFIDDIQANMLAAEETGMLGILHVTPAETARQLAGLLELPDLAGGPVAGPPVADAPPAGLVSAPEPESPAETPSR
jgi:putative hydrolase of the HAD superfamily